MKNRQQIVREYKRQSRWRNWETYLSELPISNNQVWLDLGCSLGNVAALLATKCSKVMAIDINNDLLEIARLENNYPNIEYIEGNLTRIESIVREKVDGIWCSFTAAYFPDFGPVLDKWSELLKPGSWIALVEINDLFGHRPLQNDSIIAFEDYYNKQRTVYDFRMGGKLNQLCLENGFKIVHTESKVDSELSFIGKADAEVLQSWSDRFDRMKGLQEFLGTEKFEDVKADFFACLQNTEHYCVSEVNFVVAKKL